MAQQLFYNLPVEMGEQIWATFVRGREALAMATKLALTAQAYRRLAYDLLPPSSILLGEFPNGLVDYRTPPRAHF